MTKRTPKGKKYRSRANIIEDILIATLDGATKTNIMYRSYLSYSQLKEYLPFVLQNGLLEYDKKRKVYRVTAKGRELLRKLDDLKI